VSGFCVSIRLNLRPETAGPVIDALGPSLRQAGLSFRSDAPGLIEGRGIEGVDLALLLNALASLSFTDAAALEALEAGVIDDLWVHVRRER
jgi:hypothetical protein